MCTKNNATFAKILLMLVTGLLLNTGSLSFNNHIVQAANSDDHQNTQWHLDSKSPPVDRSTTVLQAKEQQSNSTDTVIIYLQDYVVKNVITIGAVVDIQNFARYTLEIGAGSDANTANYRQLALGFQALRSAEVIATFDTRRVPNGIYTLRLRAFNTNGSYSADTRQIFIQNFESDQFEPDDDYIYGDSRLIQAPTTESHTLHHEEDVDYIHFTTKQGWMYLIQVIGPSDSILTDLRYNDYDRFWQTAENNSYLFFSIDGNYGDSAPDSPLNYFLRVEAKHKYGTEPFIPIQYTVKFMEYRNFVPPTPTPQPTPTPVACSDPDIYESDNTQAQAHPITPDAPAQTHNFGCGAIDEDWFQLDAAADQTYYWVANNVSSTADPTIELIDADGNIIAADYGFYPGLGYMLIWRSSTTQTVYARVQNWSGTVNTQNTYTIRLLTDSSINHLYIPILQSYPKQ